MTLMITVTILTKDSEALLAKVLDSVISFDEVILLDTGSTDSTLEIAAKYPNVKIHTSPFIGFGRLRNRVAELASHNWILSLDSDEILSPPLINELTTLPLSPDTVYSIPFHNIFNGKHIKWCGWHPDRHIRLYNKSRTSFTDAHVHEGVVTQNMRTQNLKYPILHHSYRTISDFLRKMQTYSDLFAEQNHTEERSSMTKAILHSSFAFFKTYLLQRGFLGGKEGFLISCYNSQTAFYKYLKLHEKNRDVSSTPLP